LLFIVLFSRVEIDPEVGFFLISHVKRFPFRRVFVS
jgi:hypothetical protein